MARRLTDVVIGVRPSLVGLRPLIELASRQVVGTSPFRSLVRAAALDAHRSAFDQRSRELTVQIRDAGLLIAAAVRRLSPGLAKRIPTGAVTRVARLKGGLDGWMLRGAERADAIRQARWPALAACLLLAIGAFAITDSRRASVLRLGVAAGLAGAVVALATLLVPASSPARSRRSTAPW
jgi:hypothetical protein